MARLIIAATLAVALSPGPALAQVGTVGGAPTPSPLGMTSPLGIGAPQPVAPTGIPLGATEIVPQGTSPGTTPSGLSTNDLAVCSGFSSSVPQASFGAPATGAASAMGTTSSPTGLATVFDGGTTGTASGTCTAGPNLASPTASASSPTGMSAGAARRPGWNPHGIHRARSRRPQPGAARRDRHAFGFVHAFDLLLLDGELNLLTRRNLRLGVSAGRDNGEQRVLLFVVHWNRRHQFGRRTSGEPTQVKAG